MVYYIILYYIYIYYINILWKFNGVVELVEISILLKHEITIFSEGFVFALFVFVPSISFVSDAEHLITIYILYIYIIYYIYYVFYINYTLYDI
jgi:hypothetical protein